MRIIFIGMLLLLTIGIHAQRTCGTDAHHAHMMETDPAYAKKYKQQVAMTKLTPEQRASLSCSGTTVIPVAVHFNDPVTCDDWECLLGAVEAQIDVLNEDFSATNNDYDNYIDLNNACPSEYPLSTAPDVGDGTCLQFCLARKNHPPASGLEDGDPAITMGLYEWASDAPPWDGYLNIFVDGSQGGLGISWLPGSGNGDGFWVTPNSFGGPGSDCWSGTTLNGSSTYGLGRTATHEAGHYFGLPHVFGGCGDSDSNPPGPVNINDTPGQNSPFFGNPTINDCGDVITQCGSNPVSFFSFMDYSDDAAMVIFTADQSDVINFWGNDISFVSDATVCSGSYGAPACAMINLPLVLDLLDTEDVACNGEANGVIEVEATGGDGNYTYELNGGDSNNTGIFTGLGGGTYTVSVFDGTNTIEIEVTIEEPDPLEIELVESINLSCFDSDDGIIEINIDGGTPNYDVELNGSGFGDDTYFDGLMADDYTIEVEDDNGCTHSLQVSISAPPELLLNLVSQVDPSCGGYTDGEVNLMGAGGTVTGNNYGYSLDGVDFQDSPTFPDLGAGTYEFYVEDENGCVVSLPVELFEPDPVLIDVTDSNEMVSCNGDTDGFVHLEGSNTVGPYTYSIDGMSYSDSGDFDDLAAGDYTFYVQDDNSCISTLDLTIEEPEPLALEIDLEVEVTCNGADDGEIQLVGVGGTSDYNFFLEDLSTPVTDYIDNLGAGTYNFIIQDANGCMGMESINLTEPDPIDITTNEITEVECFGDETGSASFSADGGTGNFDYTIGSETNSDGEFMNMTSGTYVLMVTDGNDCSAEFIFDIGQTSDLILDVSIDSNNECAGEMNGAFTLTGNGGVGTYMYSLDGVNFDSQNTFSGLSGGIYDVFVIDDNDCITVNSAIIDEPEPIALEATEVGSIDCYGEATGIISVDATGGADGYSYTLDAETNDSGIFMNLTAGTYLIQVVDINNCSMEIEYSIEEPAEIVSTVSSTNNSCEGQMVGTVSVTAQGGTGMLTYELNGETNTTGNFVDLAGGNYTAIIMDENGCSVNEAVVLENDINLVLDLTSSISPTCNDTEDGSITVTADGGNGDYTYTLGAEMNTTGVFENLPAGDYSVIVADPMGCSTSLDVNVMATPLIDLSDAQINNVLCFGESTGSVELDAGGGSGTLSFTMNGETNTTGTFENLPAGEYDVLVSDENDCETISIVTIDEPLELMEVSNSVVNVICFGGADGEININGAGGFGDLTYMIDGVGSNADGVFTNLTGGTYDVLIIDENNCSVSRSITVEQPNEILSDLVQQENVDCFGESSGAIEFAATGGTGQLTYSLEGQENTEGIFLNLSAGTYTAMVTDAMGCEAPYEFTIEQSDELILGTTAVDAGAEGVGAITTEILGGTAPYVLSLGDGTLADGDNSFQNLAPGFYTVDLTDSNGCSSSTEVEIRLIDLYDGQPDGITINESICPNPTSDFILIKYESTSDQNIIFEFYDDSGKYIGNRAMFATTGPNEIQIDVRDFASSTYILKIQSERQDRHLKFLKID